MHTNQKITLLIAALCLSVIFIGYQYLVPEDFSEEMEESLRVFEERKNVLAKDRYGVYFDNMFLEGIDPETAEFISTRALRDKNGIYNITNPYYESTREYSVEQIKGADSATFQKLQTPHAIDAFNVYVFDSYGGDAALNRRC